MKKLGNRGDSSRIIPVKQAGCYIGVSKSSSLSSLLARRWSWIEFKKKRLQKSISICTSSSVSLKLQNISKTTSSLQAQPLQIKESERPKIDCHFSQPLQVNLIIITITTLLYNLHRLVHHRHHSHKMVEGSLWSEVFLNRSVCFINPQILPPQLLKQAAFHQFRAKPSHITTHKPSGLISPCLRISSCPHVHRLLKTQHTNFSLYLEKRH